MRLFEQEKVTETGAYSIFFYELGIPVRIIVDDCLPCYEWGPIAVTHSKDPELWVSLLEKAFGKLHVTYEGITAGPMHMAQSMLTGAPSDHFYLKGPELESRLDEMREAEA
jgi:hypothetical protein